MQLLDNMLILLAGNVTASSFAAMLLADYKRRFLYPAYQTARKLLGNNREAREVSDAAVDLVLARFAAGKLGEELTRRFESDDEYDTNVHNYLRMAVKHAVIDLVRAKRAEQRRRDGLSAISAAADSGDHPAIAESRREIIDRVRQAIDELPRDLQYVIRSYYYDGLTCSQIAKERNKPKGTVKYWLSEGREKLRGRLADIDWD